MYVGWLWPGCWESMGSEVEELGALLCSAAVPYTKKRVRPVGNVGLSPNSLSTSNLTCFLLSLSSMGLPSHCTLLLDSWGLSCKWRCSMEWLSHSSAGRDHGGLGESDWCQLRHGGEGFGSSLTYSFPWNGSISLTWIVLLRCLLLVAWLTLPPWASWGGLGLWSGMAMGIPLASQRWPRQSSCTL